MENEKKLADIMIEDDATIEQAAQEVLEDETEDSEKSSDKKSSKASKKLEKKIKELEEKNEKLIKEKDEYLNHLKKERAEFDNFRKRKNAEVGSSFTNGSNDAITKILPVLDNFDLALANVPEGMEENEFVKGVSNLSKLFVDTLGSMEVTEIDAVGKPFDHNYHEAILQVDKEEGEEEGVVKMVAQKGYMKGEKVLRYAKVIVTK